MSDLRIELMTGIFKDDSQSTDKYQCLYYDYNSSQTAFVAKKTRFDTFQNADAYLPTYNANFLYKLTRDFDNVTTNSNSVLFTGNDYKFYKLDITISSSNADIDYSQVLSDINTNLTNLNTNIVNKNNQSDIVDCLNNIFCYTSNDNSKISCIKDSYNNALSNKNVLNAANIINMLRKLQQIFYNGSADYNSGFVTDNKILDNISKKLSSTVPNDSEAYTSSIRVLLYDIFQTLISSPSNLAPDIRSNSLIKAISNKLADSNDLHTISHAIDLISTAIAQTPTTDTTNLEQGLTEIKESIENKDNILIVDGEQTFKFREKDS